MPPVEKFTCLKGKQKKTATARKTFRFGEERKLSPRIFGKLFSFCSSSFSVFSFLVLHLVSPLLSRQLLILIVFLTHISLNPHPRSTYTEKHHPRWHHHLRPNSCTNSYAPGISLRLFSLCGFLVRQQRKIDCQSTTKRDNVAEWMWFLFHENFFSPRLLYGNDLRFALIINFGFEDGFPDERIYFRDASGFRDVNMCLRFR